MPLFFLALTQQDFDRIEAAISKAEETTSGEIVPVIVRRSSNVAHVAPMLTLFLLVCLFFIRPHFLDILWITPWIYLWPILVFVLFVVTIFLARLKWIQKIFVSNSDEVLSVHNRAELEFYRNKVYRTEAGTGILIFISVMERKAVILADKGISDKISHEHWQDVLNKFNDKLKAKKWADAFVEAIEICGQDLSAHFPIKENYINELKNHLIVKD